MENKKNLYSKSVLEACTDIWWWTAPTITQTTAAQPALFSPLYHHLVALVPHC